MSIVEEHSSIHTQEAFIQLRKFSPVDLRKADLIDRLQHFRCKALGWTLLFGLTNVEQKICDALWDLAHRADLFDFFHRVRSGEKVNSLINIPSENRPVLHMASRSFLKMEQPYAEKVRLNAVEQRERISQFVEDVS